MRQTQVSLTFHCLRQTRTRWSISFCDDERGKSPSSMSNPHRCLRFGDALAALLPEPPLFYTILQNNVAPRWRFFHFLSFSLSFPFPFPFIILSFPFLFPFLSLSHSPFLSLSFPFPFRSLSCLFYFFSLFFSFPFPFPCGSYANFKPPCKTRLSDIPARR